MKQEINEHLLREVHERYLMQRERIRLSHKQIGDRLGEGRFRASRLYGCPIADHYAREGKPVTHPHRYSLLQRFEQGNRVADAWQEAFVWASTHQDFPGLTVDYEAPLEDDVLVGQADLVVNGIPIEIKNTNRFQVFYGHTLQLMAYCRLLKAPHGFLVYQAEFKNTIYKVNADDDLVAQAILNIAAPLSAPEDVHEIRPGECVVETDVEDILPHEAKRSNPRTGVKKGDIVEGKGTVRCQYFGHCFPWSHGAYTFTTSSTREQFESGRVGYVNPHKGTYEE